MSGKILKFDEMLSPQVANLDRKKTAFFLPISPIEGHGPHLPLGVDFFNAILFADKTAEIVIAKRPDFDAVVLPGIPLGTQVYRLPGSLRVDSRSIYKIVLAVGESLALWGFNYIFVLSGHGSPKNIVALETAAIKVSRKYGIQMHSLSGPLAVRFLRGEYADRISALLPQPLSQDDKDLLKNDTHGGRWETSMMLLTHPQLVDPIYRKLRTVARNDSDRKLKGYTGSPSLADKSFAEASLKVLTEEGGAIVERILNSSNNKDDTISPLYRVLILRPNFYRTLYIAVLVVAAIILLGMILLDNLR